MRAIPAAVVVLATVWLGTFCGFAPAQETAKGDAAGRWKALQFLIGDWVAEGDGATGGASGGYSFKAELDNQILVRRNYAEYGGASASRHDDLLIVYAEAPGERMRAIYFDSEGHVIRYDVNASGGDSVVFDSEAGQPGPKYRLSYRLVGQRVAGKFEIAAPGSAEYKTYLSWVSVRK